MSGYRNPYPGTSYPRMPQDDLPTPKTKPLAPAPMDFNSILGSAALSRDAKRARLLGLLRSGQGGALKKQLENYLTQLKVDPFEVSRGSTRSWVPAPAWDKAGKRLSNDNADLLATGALAVSPERWLSILGGQADPLVGPGFKGQDVPKAVFGQERNPMWQQGALDFNSILANPNLSLASKQAKLNNILNGGNGAEKKRLLNKLLSEMGQQTVNSFDTRAYVNAALRVAPDVWAKTLLPYSSGTWQEFQYNK